MVPQRRKISKILAAGDGAISNTTLVGTNSVWAKEHFLNVTIDQMITAVPSQMIKWVDEELSYSVVPRREQRLPPMNRKQRRKQRALCKA